MQQIRPCPCCNGTDLYFGSDSVSSQCVQCYACGCRVIKRTPEWPNLPKLRRGLPAKDRLKALDELVLNQAIEAWNYRVPVRNLLQVIVNAAVPLEALLIAEHTHSVLSPDMVEEIQSAVKKIRETVIQENSYKNPD